MEIYSNSDEETRAFASEFAKKLVPGDVVCLTGDLGAGKTTFTKGIAKTLGCDYEPVSPTFNIVNQYGGNPPLYHFDLYRLGSEQDLYGIDIDSYLFSGGICVIEWPEIALNFLENYYLVTFRTLADGRQIKITRSDGK